MTHDRYQVIDYSVPTNLVEYGHMSLKPTVLDPFKNIVMPFDNVVWGFIVLTVVITCLAFLLLYWTYDYLEWKLPFQLRQMQNKLDFIILPVGMLVQQDRICWFSRSSKRSAGSLMVLVWSPQCADTHNWRI